MSRRKKSQAGARSKRATTSKPDESPDLESMLDRAVTSLPFRVLAGVIAVGVVAGWLAARPYLERYAATAQTDEIEVRFAWPSSRAGAQTWLPVQVQRLLSDIAGSNISRDPFSRDSLEAARRDLLATGWFEQIDRVHRRPGGVVTVSGTWRIPAAVVRFEHSDHLVARDGEVLRLPPSTPVAAGSMPIILNPTQGPPLDGGMLMFGRPWGGEDVQSAVRLIEHLRAEDSFERVMGVDLSGYAEHGHLALLTDMGAKVVWGSPLGTVAPGEVSTEKKLANLRDILQQRLDARHQRIEIFPPVVLIDKTTHE